MLTLQRQPKSLIGGLAGDLKRWQATHGDGNTTILTVMGMRFNFRRGWRRITDDKTCTGYYGSRNGKQVWGIEADRSHRPQWGNNHGLFHIRRTEGRI